MPVSLTAALLGDPAPDRLARAEALRRRLPTPSRRAASRVERPAFSYDPQARLVYVRLSAARVAESTEAAPGVILDLDAEGNVAGIEISNSGEPMAEDSSGRRGHR